MGKATTNQFDKIMKETSDFSTQYSDAYAKSSAIAMKGFEDIVGAVMSLAQDTAEKQANYIREAMSVKTINEFAEVQNKVAQANFDDFMSGVTKTSEITGKVLTESVEPVNEQMSKAIQKATQAMAA